MSKFLQISRKVHRMMVLVVIPLVLVMAGTGTVMKFGMVGIDDLERARTFHNNVSPFLTLALAVMIVTGGAMYLTPWLVGLGTKKYK